MTNGTNVRWKRTLVGGVAPHVISIAPLIAAIVAYTFLVAFATGGEPARGSLHQLDTSFLVATIVLTVVAAAWVVRTVDRTTAVAHGFAVGFLVAVIGLGFGALDATMGVRFAVTIAAGVLGAKVEPLIFGR